MAESPDDNGILVRGLNIDNETYRTITLLAYSSNISIEKVINDMLKRQLAIQGFLKNGFQFFHKDIVKILADAIPEDQLAPQARKFPTLPAEMVILNVDGRKPDLKKYIKSFTSFMNVNGYTVEIQENNHEGTISFYTRHNISHKYSLFWGEIIKMTLDNLAEIIREEFTNTSIYLECKVLPSKR